MIPLPVAAIGGSIARHWKAALIAGMTIAIAMLKLSLMSEQRHSAEVERRLSETTMMVERERDQVRARTAIAQAQDEAHARRIERDQILVSQESLSAYRKDIAALRARASGGVRSGTAQGASGRGGAAPMPGIPGATVGTDGAAGENGLPEADQLIASEIALRLMALQDWVRDQQRVER